MLHGLALPMPCDSDENEFYITTDDWKERACVKKKCTCFHEYLIVNTKTLKYNELVNFS